MVWPRIAQKKKCPKQKFLEKPTLPGNSPKKLEVAGDPHGMWQFFVFTRNGFSQKWPNLDYILLAFFSQTNTTSFNSPNCDNRAVWPTKHIWKALTL